MYNLRIYGISAALAGVTLALVGTAVQAQVETASDGEGSGGVGLHLAAAFPAGDLQKSLDTRFGFGGFATLWLNRAATIGLRVDGSLFFLGSKRRTASFALPGAIAPARYEITTKADMLAFTIGPQLSKRLGPVIPYLTIGGGPSHVGTSEDVKTRLGSEFDEPIASNSLAGNSSTAWQVGGGLYVNVGQGAFLGLSLHYLDGGHFRYIPPASVRLGPDETPMFDVVETDMRYIVVQISLSGWRGI